MRNWREHITHDIAARVLNNEEIMSYTIPNNISNNMLLDDEKLANDANLQSVICDHCGTQYAVSVANFEGRYHHQFNCNACGGSWTEYLDDDVFREVQERITALKASGALSAASQNTSLPAEVEGVAQTSTSMAVAADDTPMAVTADDTPMAVTADDTPMVMSVDDIPMVMSADDTPMAVSADDTPMVMSVDDIPMVMSADDTPMAVSADDTPMAVAADDTPMAVTADDTPMAVAADDTPMVMSAYDIPRAVTADDTLMAVTADGTPRTVTVDGTSMVLDADGTLSAVAADGTPRTVTADGTSMVLDADGTLSAVAADGTPRTVTADGTSMVLDADGTPRAVAADGTLSAVAADGTLSAVAADGAPRAATANYKPVTSATGNEWTVENSVASETGAAQGKDWTVVNSKGVEGAAPDGTDLAALPQTSHLVHEEVPGAAALAAELADPSAKGFAEASAEEASAEGSADGEEADTSLVGAEFVVRIPRKPTLVTKLSKRVATMLSTPTLSRVRLWPLATSSALLVMIFLLTGGYFYISRYEVINANPVAIGVYREIGLSISPVEGMEVAIENIKREAVITPGESTQFEFDIEMILTNTSEVEKRLPFLRMYLLNSVGNSIDFWDVDLGGRLLAPGEQTEIMTPLPQQYSGDERIESIRAYLLTDQERQILGLNPNILTQRIVN